MVRGGSVWGGEDWVVGGVRLDYGLKEPPCTTPVGGERPGLLVVRLVQGYVKLIQSKDECCFGYTGLPLAREVGLYPFGELRR